MTTDEILGKLRAIYVEQKRDWDASYGAFMADVERRGGCPAVELGKATGAAVATERPTGDVGCYSFEMALRAPRSRFRVEAEDVDAVGGEAIWLVVYGATVLPLVEARWHSAVAPRGKLALTSADLLDDEWIAGHPELGDLALAVADAIARCGWQLVGPDATEQPRPADWPWPMPSHDYHPGQYIVRDYIITGMRDY